MGKFNQKFIFTAFILGLLTFLSFPKYATVEACTSECTNQISTDHDRLRPAINEHTSEKWKEHREWLLTDDDGFFKNQVLPALMLFTEQMSAIAMHQVFAIGTFLDAKQQLETQRLLQELQNEAHKDYQPSEDFCYFGTNVRSLANSEQNARDNALLLSRRQMARHLGQDNIGGAVSQDQDKAGRWVEFTKLFCDPQDNNWFSGAGATGLSLACQPVSGYVPTPQHTNADIDYTRVIEKARTISLQDGYFSFDLTYDADVNLNRNESAIFALGNNLYGHNVLSRAASRQKLQTKQFQNLYFALRSVAAKRSVAENSFNAIVGMKSMGTSSLAATNANTSEFLGAILVELGIDPADVRPMIGTHPSYYAQLEILAKRIYQNPDFYANLYDKPANVKRKGVALQAIELMLDRAIYESQMRQEMAASVLLSARLHEPFKEVNRNLQAGD